MCVNENYDGIIEIKHLKIKVFDTNYVDIKWVHKLQILVGFRYRKLKINQLISHLNIDH